MDERPILSINAAKIERDGSDDPNGGSSNIGGFLGSTITIGPRTIGPIGSIATIETATQNREAGGTSSEGEKQLKKKNKRKFCSVM